MKTVTIFRRIAPLLPLAYVVGASAITPVTVERHVLLHVEAVAVGDGPPRGTGASKDVEVGPRRAETLSFHVPWNGVAKGLEVSLELTLTGSDPTGDLVLKCRAEVTPPGKAVVRSSRDIRFSDEGTALFEVFGDAEGRVVLTLQGERVTRAVAGPIPSPGDPVRFLVAIEGVEGDRSEVLETNELNTFVGQSVEYGFRQGVNESLETIRLVLLPESISGDLITIRAEISGVIPGPGGPSTISRSDRIVASRRAMSSVAATAGTPLAGYRFQITPDF